MPGVNLNYNTAVFTYLQQRRCYRFVIIHGYVINMIVPMHDWIARDNIKAGYESILLKTI